MMLMRIEITKGYAVEYIEDFYVEPHSSQLLAALLALPLTAELVKRGGKTHVTKRRSAQYGVQYNYNPLAKKAENWTPLMLQIKERMETAAGHLDGGLVQIYPTGEAPLGWHHDKGDPDIIASLSLGAERYFRFGEPVGKTCKEAFRMLLRHGSLLLIPADVNRVYKHEVPKMKRVTEPRVNVTLRRFPR
jgi:alkylated DNA repair dioxygenase AlkB